MKIYTAIYPSIRFLYPLDPIRVAVGERGVPLQNVRSFFYFVLHLSTPGKLPWYLFNRLVEHTVDLVK